jgi:hypothetical protein
MSRPKNMPIAVYLRRERDRLRGKRAAPDYLAAERRRNRLRMRRARAENPSYGQATAR